MRSNNASSNAPSEQYALTTRYHELAVFPEDTDIPLTTLHTYWQGTGSLEDWDGKRKISAQALVPFEYEVGELGDDEVEITIEHCSICHSDLSVINNKWRDPVFPPSHSQSGGRIHSYYMRSSHEVDLFRSFLSTLADQFSSCNTTEPPADSYQFLPVNFR